MRRNTIGNHAWRVVQCRDTTSRYVTDETTGTRRLDQMPAVALGYEWRHLDERFEDWCQARDWPKYDFNDGQYLGLPRSLRKLHDTCPWAHPSRADDKKPQMEAPQ